MAYVLYRGLISFIFLEIVKKKLVYVIHSFVVKMKDSRFKKEERKKLYRRVKRQTKKAFAHSRNCQLA